jgi:hypothetical protein
VGVAVALSKQNMTVIARRSRRPSTSRRVLAFASIALAFVVVLLIDYPFNTDFFKLFTPPPNDNNDITTESKVVVDITTESKVLVVSLNMGDDRVNYMEAIQNHESYAACHGYEFFNAEKEVSARMRSASVHPYMKKAFALQYIFSNAEYSKFDYILWVDRDAIFMNHGISIDDRLNQLDAAIKSRDGADARGVDTYDLLVAVERWAWLNSGVLLFRNTPSSKKIIDDWISTYKSRQRFYKSNDYIHIGGIKRTFRDLFKPTWSCEDQGALIALLAGYDEGKKWNTDRFDGLGVPHVLHEGHADWAALSSSLILDPKYQSQVKIVSQEWLNTNPWDQARYEQTEKKKGRDIIDPFIFHFNGQSNKPALIQEFSGKVKQCPKPWRTSLESVASI